jgi:hypothetical protein
VWAIAGTGAVVTALAGQAISAIGPDHWSWLGLLQDLVTSAFLAGLLTYLVDDAKKHQARIELERANARFVQQSLPMIEMALTAWTPEATQEGLRAAAEATVGQSATVVTFDEATLSTSSRLFLAHYTLAAMAAACLHLTGPAVRDKAGAVVGTSLADARDHLATLVRELKLYADNGGRPRRVVYTRYLIDELASVSAGPEGGLAVAAGRFRRQAVAWLGAVEGLNAAVRHGLGPCSEDRRSGETFGDPGVVLHRWVTDLQALALANSTTEASFSEALMNGVASLRALHDEVVLAAGATDALKMLIEAAADAPQIH